MTRVIQENRDLQKNKFLQTSVSCPSFSVMNNNGDDSFFRKPLSVPPLGARGLNFIQMKTLIFCIFITCIQLVSAANIGTAPANNFVPGEKLNYWIGFSSALTGKISAGTAQVQILPNKSVVNNRKAYHIVGKGGTKGFVEFFYVIGYNFESYVDDQELTPLKTIVQKHENSYKKNDAITYNYKNQIATSSNAKTAIPMNVQDMLSAFYMARNHDISGFKPGDYMKIPIYLDDSVYHSKIVYFGKQSVETSLGKYSCLVFKPLVVVGKIFKHEYPATMWVTDDNKRIPVLMEFKLAVGKIRVELTE